MNELLASLRLRYRYPAIVLRAMVVTDFRLRYQASLLGYLWTLLKPLAVFTILYIVFARLLTIGTDVPHYGIYLLLGIVIWMFFVEVTNTGLASLVGRADLLRKIRFPRYVVVLSVGVSAMINFGLNMLVILAFLVAARVQVNAGLLWLPLLFVELVALAVAISFFLSGLYVRFRDLTYIWEVLMQAGFYAVPIIYPLTMVSERYPGVARLLMINPMAQIIQDARALLVTDQAITMTQLFGTPWARLIPIGITALLVVTSVVFFRRRSPTFAEEA